MEEKERYGPRWLQINAYRDASMTTYKNGYMEKRLQLQQDLEALTSIPTDDLAQAADMLMNFDKYWQQIVDSPKA